MIRKWESYFQKLHSLSTIMEACRLCNPKEVVTSCESVLSCGWIWWWDLYGCCCEFVCCRRMTGIDHSRLIFDACYKKWCCNCSTLAVFRFSHMHHRSKNTLRSKCMTATLLWTTPSDLFLVIIAGKAYVLCVSLLAIYPWRTFSKDQNANQIPPYFCIKIQLSR